MTRDPSPSGLTGRYARPVQARQVAGCSAFQPPALRPAHRTAVAPPRRRRLSRPSGRPKAKAGKASYAYLGWKSSHGKAPGNIVSWSFRCVGRALPATSTSNWNKSCDYGCPTQDFVTPGAQTRYSVAQQRLHRWRHYPRGAHARYGRHSVQYADDTDHRRPSSSPGSAPTLVSTDQT